MNGRNEGKSACRRYLKKNAVNLPEKGREKKRENVKYE